MTTHDEVMADNSAHLGKVGANPAVSCPLNHKFDEGGNAAHKNDEGGDGQQ